MVKSRPIIALDESRQRTYKHGESKRQSAMSRQPTPSGECYCDRPDFRSTGTNFFAEDVQIRSRNASIAWPAVSLGLQ